MSWWLFVFGYDYISVLQNSFHLLFFSFSIVVINFDLQYGDGLFNVIFEKSSLSFGCCPRKKAGSVVLTVIIIRSCIFKMRPGFMIQNS